MNRVFNKGRKSVVPILKTCYRLRNNKMHWPRTRLFCVICGARERLTKLKWGSIKGEKGQDFLSCQRTWQLCFYLRFCLWPWENWEVTERQCDGIICALAGQTLWAEAMWKLERHLQFFQHYLELGIKKWSYSLNTGLCAWSMAVSYAMLCWCLWEACTFLSEYRGVIVGSREDKGGSGKRGGGGCIRDAK